ncbi:MAG: 30S ribosomal protein S2 [Alphaproteobacteria bacterium]|nr:MAG: 30S ribosomal protein S2 [Alphaproteobacteria bacterium]
MALPTFTMRQLLEAGVHFGHQSHRWNPKMKEYIFGARNKVHILNLSITVPLLHRALETVRDVTASGGRVLFVGTKRQASGPIAEAAKRCGQYYVNHRWLGGMMTNWETISKSIKRLKELDAKLSEDIAGLTKKEILQMTRERDKLERALGGIKDMGGIPNVLFVIDTNKEELAIQEANKLGIPVVAILDSNSNPDNVTFPIPGNDDATRAIQLYCDLISGAVLDGIQQELVEQGVDVGAAVEAPVVEELAPEVASVEETAAPEAAAPETAAVETAAVETAPVEEAAKEVKKEVKVKAKASK